jgi:DNA-binding NtrC family response regulator
LDGAATPPIKEAPPPNSRTAVDLPTPEWIRGDEGLTDTQVEAYAAVTFYKTKSAAAKKLGIHRKTLEERLQRGKARADNARAKRRSNT